MSALGDLLELVHGAQGSYRTVRLRAREWRHDARSMLAHERWQAAHGGATAVAVLLGTGDPEPGPEEHESTIALWLSPPRARAETVSDGDVCLTVIDGDRWWSHDPDMGAITNDGDPGYQTGAGEELRALLEPALLIPFVDLSIGESVEAAGRQAIRVLARPRAERPNHHGMSPLPPGADEHELLVDAERGVLLRLESRIEGAPYSVAEILEVAFDEEFPTDTFVFRSPDGRPARPVGEAFPMHEPLQLHEAASRAPFTVFVPTLVPEGAELTASYIAARDDPPGVAASLHLSYAHHSHNLSIMETLIADGDWGDIGWEERESAGRRYLVREEHGSRNLLVDIEGTRVFMTGSGLDLAALIDVAASLVPASPEPPHLVPAS